MPKDQSQLEEMRAAIRGDIERNKARQEGGSLPSERSTPLPKSNAGAIPKLTPARPRPAEPEPIEPEPTELEPTEPEVGDSVDEPGPAAEAQSDPATAEPEPKRGFLASLFRRR